MPVLTVLTVMLLLRGLVVRMAQPTGRGHFFIGKVRRAHQSTTK